VRTLDYQQRQAETEKIVAGNWPHYPVLPVKRYREGGWPDAGIIFHRDDLPYGPVKVYFCNIFDLAAKATDEKLHDRDKPVTYADVLANVPTKEYPNLDEFFNDGWMGD